MARAEVKASARLTLLPSRKAGLKTFPHLGQRLDRDATSAVLFDGAEAGI
jgi:hypothetical protein